MEVVVDMSHYEDLGCLHEMLSRQAALTPDVVAVVAADGTQLTYRELDDVTDSVATYLQLQGVKLEDVVGIYMDRCIDYTVAYIAILKAGAAYMPLALSYPMPLLADIISDSAPAAIFVEDSVAQNVKDCRNVILCANGWTDHIKEELSKHQQLPSRPKVSLDNLAYTVYSSGTTGKPKGIQCPHRGAVFSYHHRHEAYPYGKDEREACNVFFVWEMLRPLLRGATLYIVPDKVIYDARLLCRFLNTHAITRLLFTPSLLEAVLDSDGIDIAHSFTSVRCVVLCGEVVTVGLLERCLRLLPAVQFVNLYSTSESHDNACCDISRWYKANKESASKRKFCPVGRVIPGVEVVILNDNLELQPMGVSGEIYVGGPTLARGYLNRPEVNAARFIARPAVVPARVGERLYRTGDWGYLLSGGAIEICGRVDSMVKIRGYSIETQAVEAALIDLEMVNACVVMAMGAEGEDKYLVAYIVPEGQTTKKQIRAELKRQLPFYMIPAFFIFLNDIPILASSGKLDKKALPAVDRCDTDLNAEGRAVTPTERRLEPLWAAVLNTDSVDIHESFFDLGGHSLLATKLLSKVQETFGVEISVRELFVHTSVSAMARLLDAQTDADYAILAEPETSINWAKEVDIHDQSAISMDIQLRAFWRSMQYGDRKWQKARVLLTGATGFLGAFLLRDLLTHTKTHVFCLVRELPNETGMERVQKQMHQLGLLAADPLHEEDEQKVLALRLDKRVTVISGDVGLMKMGLSDDDYTYLSTEIDFIVHAAAYVNLIYPYQALHGPNVLGTQNVIKFACDSKIKPLHYISTDAVFPPGLAACAEDAYMTSHAAHLQDGYSQSKWVAEQLVLRAADRGLPATVYRLGNLAGESKKAHWNPQDFTLHMLRGCLATGQAPQVEWRVEMTPVDWVSHTIVTLTQRMTLVLGKVFHVIDINAIKSRWLFEWVSAHGYPMKMVPFDKWKNTIQSSTNESVATLARLLETMITDESYFTNLSTYRRDQLDKVLEEIDRPYPEITHQQLETYFRHLARMRLIPTRRTITADTNENK